VLFNTAAVMSQQALQTERGSSDGITQACKLFQARRATACSPASPPPPRPTLGLRQLLPGATLSVTNPAAVLMCVQHQKHMNPRPPQEAAGMFDYLKEHEANKVDAPVPVDLNPECCALMEKLMLAQAQVRRPPAGPRGLPCCIYREEIAPAVRARAPLTASQCVTTHCHPLTPTPAGVCVPQSADGPDEPPSHPMHTDPHT
jgi:hypothetical protein